MHVICASRISHVTVHARGALVTRRVEAPGPLPDEDVDLIVPDVSVLADGGSVRAALAGARQVVSVQTTLHIPEDTASPGESTERVRIATGKLARATAEHESVAARRQALAQLALDPRLRVGAFADKVDGRTADALAASALLGALLAQMDARLVALDQSLRELGRELEAARLAYAQATSGARMGTGHPTRRITVRLAGAGPVEAIDLTYQIPAARWWPVYTLRISDEGRRAEWWLEALVAQLTGEDWNGVALSLSTADLIADARLPELPSLRLGRAQPPARRAYRPAPAGLDRMFDGYDRAFAASMREQQPMRMIGAIEAPAAPPPQAEPRPPSYGIVPPPMAAAPQRTMMLAAGMPSAIPGRAAPAQKSRGPAPTDAVSDEESGEEPEPTLEPAEAWLDFDSLSLARLEDTSRRGRLVLAAPAGLADRAPAERRIDALGPAGVRDPAASRGLFDHRYDAAGRTDVPSDGLTHRVTVGIGETPPALRWRTVPREAPEVYREAALENPFPAPLLAGPVDVYVEGSLLLTSSIERIDVGGVMTVGMGVEDRLRVARNARADEDTAGLLGGSTVVDTTVTIDLASSLGRDAEVQVLDRIPVTDEKGLEVELVSTRPEAKRYDQADRGSPVRGGLRWSVTVPAGGKTRLELRYRVSFPSKNELLGGNRRE